MYNCLIKETKSSIQRVPRTFLPTPTKFCFIHEFTYGKKKAEPCGCTLVHSMYRNDTLYVNLTMVCERSTE